MKKPIVIDRPWWRNPIFPRGWYSLRRDIKPEQDQHITLDFHYTPGDGGAEYCFTYAYADDGGLVITPIGGDGEPWTRADGLTEWSVKGFAIRDIKEQPFF